MNGENRETIQELLSILRDKKAILFAGAGCSKISGYPSWPELIEDMRKKYVPSLNLSSGVDYSICADQIKDKMVREGLEREYSTYLGRTFRPQPERPHTPFHLALIQLGFSGIVTTNYDVLLEDAVEEVFSSSQRCRCNPIDLCLQESYKYRIFEFLRKLSPSSKHPEILHIHGYYLNHDSIILTKKDYQKAYGEFSDDEANVTRKRPLDTIHRKVIWSLLTMHPILFVGFSMDDEFFMNMLDIVQEDFNLGQDCVHYAIMEYKNESERDMTSDKLKRKGIGTVFYQIVNRGSSNNPDHSGLVRLISELANELEIKIESSSFRILNEEMLER